ncbi:MAG: hypothetical protein AB2L14_21735 [Candidatus Xenobiia bacterium LiM19]
MKEFYSMCKEVFLPESCVLIKRIGSNRKNQIVAGLKKDLEFRSQQWD